MCILTLKSYRLTDTGNYSISVEYEIRNGGIAVATKLKISIAAVCVFLTLAVYINYSIAVSPKTIGTTKLNESIQKIKSDYGIKRIEVKNNRENFVSVELYFEDEQPKETVKHIFRDCALALTDPQTLAYINDNYYTHEVSPKFSIKINFHVRTGNSYILIEGFESLINQDNEDFDLWGYSNWTTGDSYYLRLSEVEIEIPWL